jgi:molybdate transport system substrate-binding protein
MEPFPGHAAVVKRSFRLILTLILCWTFISAAQAAELLVAAASDLKFAMDELVAQFRTNEPSIQVKATYGSSGTFFAQIQNQAPFDLYYSADAEYPRKLAAAGLALDTNVFLYAVGRLVLWAPASSSLDLERLKIKALLEPSVKKIAIANPAHAPYGRAAVAALKSLGVHRQVEHQLVFGENIAQTAQFLQSGAAEAGFIALSLALAPQMKASGAFWNVPLDAYPKIEQGGIISKGTKEPAAARKFRDFTLSSQGRKTLKQWGLFPPEGK